MFHDKNAQIMEEYGLEHTWADIIKDPEDNPYAYQKLSAPQGKALFGAPPKP